MNKSNALLVFANGGALFIASMIMRINGLESVGIPAEIVGAATAITAAVAMLLPERNKEND